jgi:class 3 adenylate cyclase
MSEAMLPTAVLFADVSGSSALFKRVGDAAARRLIAACVDRMCEAVVTHGGSVVKTIGDEVMARFESPGAALDAAIAMQRATLHSDDGLALRIGAAWGPAIHEDGDVYGRVVNDAAAVGKIARGRQLLVDEALHRDLDRARQAGLAAFDRINLKGGEIATTIYRAQWEVDAGLDDATRFEAVLDDAEASTGARLLLQFDDQQHELTADGGPFVIGRDPNKAHLALPHAWVSRDHCHIAHQNGKFVLADHSSNGTWVKPQGGAAIYLRREETPLQGSGIVAAGQAPDQAGTPLILYRLSE